MKGVLAYVRNLLGWYVDDPVVGTSFKRDRIDDDLSDDDESPALKRIKRLKKTAFPETMSSRDVWDKEESPKNVRYVPIQVERGHPSTSTPNEGSFRLASRLRPVPFKLLDRNGSLTPNRKPRMHTPIRPVSHAFVDDDDDEVTLVQSKPETSKRSPQLYIDVDEHSDQIDDDDDDDDDDVIFVKRVTPPPAVKPFKFFVTKNTAQSEDCNDGEPVQYYKLCKRLNERNISKESPRSHNKFQGPAGITKTYKRTPANVPRWLQGQRTSNHLPNRSRIQTVNGNARSTLSEVFNLDEKKSYQELIRRVTGNLRPAPKTDFVIAPKQTTVFRNIQRPQRSILDKLNLLEKSISVDSESEESKESDPITVTSIHSSDSEVEVVPSEASTSSSERIERVNSLRESLRKKDITSNDWITKLNCKYKQKDQYMQEKLKDATRQSDIISKVNHKHNLALLEHKLKYELSLPESLVEEPLATVEIPKLTPEQEKLVDKALGPGPSGQLLVEKFNLRIHRRDLQTLAGLNWLNDEVINFYMNLLMQRSEQRKELPRVYAANTFFYPKLMQTGQTGLKRWTRKVDIFAHDLMVVPIHLGVHWCLSLVDFGAKRVSYLDSMGGRNQPCLNALMQYLRDEHKDKKGKPFDDSGWTTESLKDIPQQMNGSDCGMFACTFAEFSCRRARYTFTQAHMPQLRRKVALEILSGKLLL